jgi:hypothetical protein
MLMGAVDCTTAFVYGDAVFSGGPLSTRVAPSEAWLMLPLGAIESIVGTISVKSPVPRDVPCMDPVCTPYGRACSRVLAPLNATHATSEAKCACATLRGSAVDPALCVHVVCDDCEEGVTSIVNIAVDKSGSTAVESDAGNGEAVDYSLAIGALMCIAAFLAAMMVANQRRVKQRGDAAAVPPTVVTVYAAIVAGRQNLRSCVHATLLVSSRGLNLARGRSTK